MALPLLQSKLFVPPSRPALVPRPRLLDKLDEALHRRLTLISAPAGFGKTTLVSAWLAGNERPTAWLSLDEGDNDPARFLAYLVAALKSVAALPADSVTGALHASQPAPGEPVLTALLNEINSVSGDFTVVLDDYHVIDAAAVHSALTFVLEHLPPRMHLVITTREDPPLPLARLRARGHLSELRAADLRFTAAEAAGFLNEVMGLNLSAAEVAALESRTEGWIAGLQLAALSLQGHPDAAGFITSFTGSHHFVLDYLLEEVLQQQPERVQDFLLRTSILDRLCAPLCDAVLGDPAAGGQKTLEAIERANLFLVPLDNERRWYRYHHLFRDLLRQRLQQRAGDVNDLHVRASQWYEAHGMEIEAFHHAAAADDVERAERLIEGEGMPLQFRGAVAPVLHWLESLPRTVLDARPSLWVTYASTLLFGGKHTTAEQKLQAAESALQGSEGDERSRDLLGRVASMRATLAVMVHDAEAIITQSRRALEYLHPDNLPVRSATTWTLGYAYQLQGDRAAASKAYSDVIAAGATSGNSIYTIAATINLGQLQEADNRLYPATENYRRVLELAGDPPQPIAAEAALGLARIHYQWNDLHAAEQYGQQCLQLTRQMESLETYVSYQLLLARLNLARGDVPGAVAVLDEAEAFARRHGFEFRMADIAAAQVLMLLRRGNHAAAAHLAETRDLPRSRARVLLAQGEAGAAVALLEPLRRQAEVKGWADERLEVMALQALAFRAHGETEQAARRLGEVLALAEPGGFVRFFVDEGMPMAHLLSKAAAHRMMPEYTARLLAAFDAEGAQRETQPNRLPATSAQPLIEPLSQRELEILRLIARGLSNREISERLFLALSTVKGHNRLIFDKLQVERRTEAVARARELGLL